jgi:hypothetical protein
VVGGGDQDRIRRRLGAGETADARRDSVSGPSGRDPGLSRHPFELAGQKRLRLLGEDDNPADRRRVEQGPRHPAQHRLAAGADQRLRGYAVRRREAVLPRPAPRQHDRGPFPHPPAIPASGPGGYRKLRARTVNRAAVADPPRLILPSLKGRGRGWVGERSETSSLSRRFGRFRRTHPWPLPFGEGKKKGPPHRGRPSLLAKASFKGRCRRRPGRRPRC